MLALPRKGWFTEKPAVEPPCALQQILGGVFLQLARWTRLPGAWSCPPWPGTPNLFSEGKPKPRLDGRSSGWIPKALVLTMAACSTCWPVARGICALGWKVSARVQCLRRVDPEAVCLLSAGMRPVQG